MNKCESKVLQGWAVGKALVLGEKKFDVNPFCRMDGERNAFSNCTREYMLSLDPPPPPSEATFLRKKIEAKLEP